MTEICVDELDVPPRAPYYFGMGLLTDNIRALRSRFRTQAEFADELDVSQPTVARWLRGSVPEHDKLKILARLAGVPAEVFTTVPAAMWSGVRTSPIPSVGELAQMLESIVLDLPPGVSYREWPRIVAEELHTRLATLASDRAIQDTQADPEAEDTPEGD